MIDGRMIDWGALAIVSLTKMSIVVVVLMIFLFHTTALLLCLFL